MRVAGVVGLSFFLLVFVGIWCIIRGSRRPKGSRERSLWQSRGLIAGAFAFLGFGLVTMYFIRTSARPVVEGSIWGVSEPVRGALSEEFKMTMDSGQAITVRCRYDGPGLRDGDRARVRYIEYNRRLVELTMLTGPYAGWHFEAPSGERGCAVWVLAGLVCGFAGYRQWRKVGPIDELS